MIRSLAQLFMKLCGWTAEGEPPPASSYVLIAAPHTTNWDFLWIIVMARVYGIEIHWIGKHTLFRWPFGPIMRYLGGVSIERHRRQNLVQQMVDEYASRESFVLIVPCEGTRSWVPNWKSGFYHIATGAGVPIAPGYLDYQRKAGGFGPLLTPSGDVRADMDVLRAFYADKRGKFPDQEGRILLKEEEQEEPEAAAGGL